MVRVLAAAVAAVTLLLASDAAWGGRLHPDVEHELRALPSGRPVSVIVHMAPRVDPAAAAAKVAPGLRAARRQAVVNALRSHATTTQAPLLAQLARERLAGRVFRVVPFWIFNGVAVTADAAVVRALAARPDVLEVRPDFVIPAPAPIVRSSIASSAAPGAEISQWNIERLRAPEVWAMNPAYTGAGVVVGSFDTGVDGNHPDLAGNYRGNHAISWFDPYGEHATPFDANGHGTHTIGIAVGGSASGTSIGVAPGARWIAAKAFNDAGQGLASAFHQIFEWFLAPGGDPENAPDVVNSSWGFAEAGCITEFVADVQAFRAAGIFPAFAAGNDGPDDGSARSPGNYPDSFTVGATDPSDAVADFSGRGPSACDGGVKPTVTAPGDDIFSAVPGGWVALSGTSMAAPHVSGAVALLKSIDPTLTVPALEGLLVQGALDLGAPGPDNAYGAGIIDVFQSAQILLGGADRPVVTIVATDASALEAGLATGAFTVTRTGATDGPLTVAYTVRGTATAGSDYVALPGSITIPAGASSASFVVTPLDDALVEPDETIVVSLSAGRDYIAGAPGVATVTLVSDDLPADLTISSLSVPPALARGVPFTVTETTSNQGGGPAVASTTTYYLSADPLRDGGDLVLGSRAVPALAPGGASSASVSLTIPPATAPGSYYVLVVADTGDAVVESQEANNLNGRIVQVGADLLVPSFTVPATAGAGATIAVTDTTVNQGTEPAPATATAYFLSTDTQYQAADTPLGSRAVPALAAGGSSTGTVSITLPAGLAAGTYYVLAHADSGGAVTEGLETNNVTWRAVLVGADLWVSAMTVPAAAGGGAALVVGDTTTNAGGGPSGPSTTAFYLSLDPTWDAGDVLLGSRAVPALAAGASSAGSTSVTIPAGTAPGAYHVIARADATGGVAESRENNNVSSRLVQVGPDLAVSSLTAPAGAGAGATLAVTDTTANQGGGGSPASTTGYYLSADAVLDAADVRLGGRAVPALAAGASSTGSASLTIPAGTGAGTYYLIARADDTAAVGESQESNNVAARTIQVGADLRITAMGVPASVAAGVAFTVTDTTANQGGGSAPASSTTFYLSVDAAWDAGDVAIGARAVPALAAGGSSAGSTPATIPAGTPAGTYHVLAVADATGAVVESQEANNVNARIVQVGADLVVSSLTVPATAGAGASLAVTETTANTGAGPAGASVTAFYLSADALLDAADVHLGSRVVPALAAGASSTASTVVAIPAGTATGAYYVLARADGGGVVGESQEGNNVTARAVQVGADLAVSAFSAPSGAGAGVPFTVTDTTVNRGGGTAAASSTGYYLSADSALDAGDALVGARSVPVLGPGASSVGSASVTLPAGTAPGTYYLIARADAGDAVAESQETNNVSARVLQVGPDLWGAALSAPAAVGAGVPFTVSQTTANQGGGPAGASTTAFYLSSNTTWDAADVPLGSRGVPALAAGGSSAASTSLALPADTPAGTYYLLARVDDGQAVAESLEGNNVASALLRVGADLRVSSLTVPAGVGAGTPFTVSDTTTNAGAGPAAGSTTRYYFSADAVLDPGDAALGDRAVGALAAGASQSGSATVTIPAGTPAGSYYLLARADDGQAVGESDEANNVLARAVQIGADLVVSALSAPAAVGAGTPFTVTDTTANQSATAAAASATGYYLSTNATLDASDVPLGARRAGARRERLRLGPGLAHAADGDGARLLLSAGEGRRRRRGDRGPGDEQRAGPPGPGRP